MKPDVDFLTRSGKSRSKRVRNNLRKIASIGVIKNACVGVYTQENTWSKRRLWSKDTRGYEVDVLTRTDNYWIRRKSNIYAGRRNTCDLYAIIAIYTRIYSGSLNNRRLTWWFSEIFVENSFFFFEVLLFRFSGHYVQARIRHNDICKRDLCRRVAFEPF